MDNVIKACAGVLVSIVIGVVLTKQGKDISLLMTAAVCCMLLTLAADYLDPVISFVFRLKNLANLDGELVSVLLKAVGIGFLGEITGLICNDAGNTAAGKGIRLLTVCAILYLSLPLFETLLSLTEEILSYL